MALRQLRTDPDEILHKRCRTVENIDGGVRTLLKDMAHTLRHTKNGAAIAAPQVGVLKCLVVIDADVFPENGAFTGMLMLVNPRIVESSGTQDCVEGCLSFPGRWAKTVRPLRVTVEAVDEKGNALRFTGEGAFAKCLCHELDHLEGVVLEDRAVGWVTR